MISWITYLKNALSRELPEDPIAEKKGTKSLKKNLANIKPFILHHWRKGILGVFLILITSFLSFPSPLITRFLIDNVILNQKMEYLLITVLLLTAIKLIMKLAATFQKFYFNRFEREVTLDIQQCLLEHTLHLPKSFFDSKDTGYLMSRLLSDVGGIRWFFSSTIIYIITYFFRFIGGVILLLYLKWQLALVVFLILPVMVFGARFFARKARILSHHSMEQHAKVNRAMQESLSTTSLIKAFSSEKRTVDNIVKQLRGSVDLDLENSTVSSLGGLMIGFIPDIARFVVLFAGAYWIIIGEWSLGSLLAFQSYMGYVYGPAQFLANANISFQRAMTSLERVSALFDIVPEENIEKGKKIKKLRGEIEFKNVTFSYGGKEEVLKDLTFKTSPGEWISIVGPSGVGKTTLISLILSFYKPDKGEILFDKLPAVKYNLKELRRRIGYVSQNPIMISGSIMDNLRYGNRDASDKQVIKASRTAGIYDFIQSLPDKYSEKLGERGVNLSEGQKQRLSLARALIKDPDILILDEPTSALDRKTESSIFTALPKAILKKTLIMISHRVSTIKSANRVLFLNEKKLIATGTHDELMKENPEYRSLMVN